MDPAVQAPLQFLRPMRASVGRAWLRRACLGGLLAGALALLAACSGTSDLFRTSEPAPPTATAGERAIGTGQVKVGLILPLSAAGNAGAVAQSMKNAAEMALAEFNSPNIQLAGQGRRRQFRRRASGGAAGAARRRRDHRRPAVRAFGRRGRRSWRASAACR